MATTLTLRAQTAEGVTERTFTRTPVFIGRKVAPGHFDMADRRASKLHASIDVRAGAISVRDAASTNGTFWNGQRLEPDRWVDLGRTDQPVEFRIGGTSFTAWVSEVAEDAPDSGVTMLFGAGAGAQSRTDTPILLRMDRHTLRIPIPVNPEQNPSENITVVRPEAGNERFDTLAAKLRLSPASQDACSAALTLERVVKLELDNAPPDARARVCGELLQTYPDLSQNRAIVRLFESYGVDVSGMKDPPDMLASTALAALQDIAVWYTGETRKLKRPDDIAQFHHHLRTALDDLLLGYAPLLSGLTRFENQLAIRSPSGSPGVASAAELASSLLDWQVDNQRARAELRASFAELMMHQVALLRGVMRGVKTLLAELSPDVIEKAVEAEVAQGGIRRLFARPDLWATYKRRHSDLSDEENERFRILFGADFVNEYRQFANEAREETSTNDPAPSPEVLPAQVPARDE